MFYYNGRKSYNWGLILNHLTAKGLAYWIMCDGSLQKNRKSIILHTQSFSHEENKMCANELAQRFGLDCQVIQHKKIYWVLYIVGPKNRIVDLVKPYFHSSMYYKLPKKDD